MATEDNLRERAKEIRGAFLPESVTNEAVGGLLLDIINFILSYGGSGGEGSKPDARYWNKEELTVLDQYLYVLGDKIKALYADNAGDSELFEGHSWKDYFDQPLRTFDPVKFKSVTSTDFESKVKGWIIDAMGDAEFRDILGRVITITGGLMTDDFIAGMTGAGTGIVNKSEVHTDRGVFRKYIEVLALVVSKMYWRGGRQCLSPAGMKVSKVEEYDDYWRLYMETEDGQTNEFTIGAQARCNNYGNGTQKYYWRLVVGIGADYVDLSKTDCDTNSGTPSVGDDVVQFGHRTDPYLQWVVMDSSFSDDAGRTIYAGVNSYDLSGKMVLRIGVSPTDPTRIGLFTRHGEFSDVIDGINQDIEDNQQAIQDTKDAADAIQTILDNLTGIIIPDMQNQLDGAIQSWDGEVEPTLNNYPANEWTTDAERAKHVGDTYIYYTTDTEGNTVSSRYNFRFVDGVYKWELIADSVSAELEVKLRELTGTVGKKNSITYSNNVPTPAYNIDDLWIKEDGSMYICRAQKMDGMQGSAADWELFNDTMLRLAKMADDGIISKEEKATLRDTWNQIQKEFVSYQAQATKYGVSITALQNAYNTLNTFLTNTVKLSQNVDTSLTVAQKTEYNQDFANYYSERTAFANIIAQKVADESIGNLQIGMVNMLKGSNVELNAQAYRLGNYYFDKKLEVGKEYTFVICYTLGANSTSIDVYQDSGYTTLGVFRKQGNKVIESKTFNYSSTRTDDYIGIYQSPNGTYGSTVHWAVLVEGNKAPNGWIPALSEQGQEAAKETVDNLQIGSVNLISRKMMLAWNEKNKDIAVWGQDSDGVYLGVNPSLLYIHVGGKVYYNDIFDNKIRYKENTQYVFSIEYKALITGDSSSNGLILYIAYTNGETVEFYKTYRTTTTKTRFDFITEKGKTVQKIYCSYGTSYVVTLIYSIGLFEGNKPLPEIPVATEDLTGQSNVNLLDGGEEVIIEENTTSAYWHAALHTPVIKPNNVYNISFQNVENLAGSPAGYEFRIVSKDKKTLYSNILRIPTGEKSGILVTTNDFTKQECNLLLYAGIGGETTGNSVKYTEVMLVEGFTPPSSYSPSPGDVAKDIKDVSDAVTSLQNFTDQAFADGIITRSEAQAIASNINVLNAEKADIDNAYTPLYNSPYLLSGTTAASNLFNAKTAYNTAHTALISEINKAIADGKATTAEKASVDDKFRDYNLALGTYKKRVEEANKAIQDRIKALAEQDATNKVDGIQIGGENLLLNGDLRYYTDGWNPGWNVQLNGNLKPTRGWDNGYDGGVSEPSKGYHLHLDIKTFGFPVMAFINRNSEFGLANRWLGTRQGFSESTRKKLLPGQKYVISFELYSDTLNGLIYGGFRHYLKGGNSKNFHSGYFEVYADEVGTWKRYSATMVLHADTDLSKSIEFYLYGYRDATDCSKYVRNISLQIGTKGDFSRAPEDVEYDIQESIAQTVDITAPSQVFKYGAGYTGTPTPASILLMALPRNFTPTSYQWQFLNGSTWTNISGATSSTYSVAPGNTTLFPSGVYTRTFRCICNGDEKLSDNFTLAKLADGATGQTGATGKPGEDGRGVKSTVVTYQSSTSGTTVPTGTWSASIPAVAANQYLWTRTVITYTDDTYTTSYSIGKMGANGAAGAAGKPGADGKGIKSTVVTYQASTSGTTVPTGTWGTTIPSVAANQYLWTRTVITYTDDKTTTSYSIGKMGATGAAGKDAYTILLTNEAHTVACDANGNPLPGELAKAKTKITAYKGTSKLAAVHSGATTGQFYVVSLTSVGGAFQLNGNDEITCTAMNADTASYTCKVYLESTSVYVEKTFVVTKAKTGATGKPGEDGKGVKSVVEQYYLSTSSTTQTGGSWSSTMPAWTTGKYLWTRLVTNYTDNSTTTSTPILDPLNEAVDKAEQLSKDDIAKQLGFTDFEALKNKNGYIDMGIIDADSLITDTAWVNSLSAKILTANAIKANMISIPGFTFKENNIIGGSDFGVGGGVKIVSTTAERSFKAYKDASHYVEMFYRSASDWGLKGVDGNVSDPIFQLGSKNTISGWEMTTVGFESKNFISPYADPDNAKGSKLFSDGGIIISPESTGILPLSNGVVQAGLIQVTRDNASVTGLEIIAKHDTGNYLATVNALVLYAENPYWNNSGNYGPQTPARAIHSKKGDVYVENGDITIASNWNNFRMENYCYTIGGCGYVPSSIFFVSTGIILDAFQTVVVCTNSSKINVTLPNSGYLQPGHIVRITPLGSAAVGIIGNGNDRILQGGSFYPWAEISATSGGIRATAVCQYIGKYNGANCWIIRSEHTSGIAF